MRRFDYLTRKSVFITMLTLPILTACDTQAPVVSTPALEVVPVSTSVLSQITPSPAQGGIVCPSEISKVVNGPLAARVNGIGVPLDLYNRQVAQGQAAILQQGLDPKSVLGQETLKNLKIQVLDQVINDTIIAQQAEKEGVRMTDDELNARASQVAQDTGGVDRLNIYLSQNQMSLSDLCAQMRSQFIGETMLNRVTAALPTNVDQVHARHILLLTSVRAQTVLAQIRQGKDFAAMAQQFSVDEASKANGGDLGWFPRGVMEPQLEAAAFQLAPGQMSDVVQTRFGYHIIKLEERESSRALSPELLANLREQAFLAWLQALRETMKIERLAPP